MRPRPGLPDYDAVLASQKAASQSEVMVESSKRPEVIAINPPVSKPVVVSAPVSTPAPLASQRFANSYSSSNSSNSSSASNSPNSSSFSGDRIRSVRDTTASEFLKYHFRAIAFKEFEIAWDDLAPAYKAKFNNNKVAYITSVSRHHLLTTSPPDSDFSVGPRQGDLVKVRVKMLRLAGYNSDWLYTLRVQDGKWYIEAVGSAP